MRQLFNPFRYIAGFKALCFGAIFIIASALLLYSGSMVQDGYIHIGYADVPLWRTIATQVAWWIIPAIALYLCGIALSKSKIRLIDMLGTTAFAQLALLLMIVPMLLPAVQNSTTELLVALQAGTLPTTTIALPLLLYGIWSIAGLALYYIWNYNAFATSCNLSGGRAIIPFVATQLLLTVLSALI